MQIGELKKLFKKHKEASLFGRYINTNNIKSLLKKYAEIFAVETIGQSVLREAIYSIKVGSGKKKLLMWSQMHGNESTTTKAVFDLLNLLSSSNGFSEIVLKECTILIIPILNPDGAKAYTRFNANKVDLNRDAQDLSQPESKVLRKVYNEFKPHYCFNLHGQRTIFSAGNTSNVATLSFLSPAQDQECSLTDNRKVAMAIISKMNDVLQLEIPNQVGVYDDAFNINCVGDTFQSFNVPTILFEAGHFANDYNREEVRRLIFQSYIIALKTIVGDLIDLEEDSKLYFNIPENKKTFFDIIINKVDFNGKIVDIAIQYQERLIDNKIHFIPKIVEIENLHSFNAHKTIDANNSKAYDHKNKELSLGSEIDFVMLNNIKFLLNI